jgi:glutamate/tyrosine decarboxylase-like PLP-dependent enzyme
MEAHHSLEKAAAMLGLGRKSLWRVPIDEQCRLDVEKLEAAIQKDLAAGKTPFCVVSTAGTPSSGAIDSLEAVGEICRHFGLWHHVDGAYGAALMMSDKQRYLLQGIEAADSVTIDPHKWLAMPFSTSAILTRHPELLPKTFNAFPPYLQHSGNSFDFYKIGLQWSRRMNSLKLWLTLRVHGRSSYEELINRQMDQGRRFARWAETSECFELASPQVLPIVNLRVKLPGGSEAEIAALNTQIVEQIVNEGKFWISATSVNGRNMIRLMIISYLTGQEHLEELQQRMQLAAEQILLSQR